MAIGIIMWFGLPLAFIIFTVYRLLVWTGLTDRIEGMGELAFFFSTLIISGVFTILAMLSTTILLVWKYVL